MSESTGISFGLTEESTQRFRNIEGQFARMDPVLLEQLQFAIDRTALELESHIRREFQSGTDSQGISHDKSGATLDTLEVHSEGLAAEIRMGGGASFVEFGRAAIDMTGMGYALHWIDWESGEDVYSYHSKAVPPDDFIGRAINDVDLHYSLSQMALGFKSEVFRSGEYGTHIGPGEGIG